MTTAKKIDLWKQNPQRLKDASAQVKEIYLSAEALQANNLKTRMDSFSGEISPLPTESVSYETFCRRFGETIMTEMKQGVIAGRALLSAGSWEEINHYARLASLSLEDVAEVLSTPTNNIRAALKAFCLGVVLENSRLKQAEGIEISDYEKAMLRGYPHLLEYKNFCEGVKFCQETTGAYPKIERGRGRISDWDSVTSLVRRRFHATKLSNSSNPV